MSEEREALLTPDDLTPFMEPGELADAVSEVVKQVIPALVAGAPVFVLTHDKELNGEQSDLWLHAVQGSLDAVSGGNGIIVVAHPDLMDLKIRTAVIHELQDRVPGMVAMAKAETGVGKENGNAKLGKEG